MFPEKERLTGDVILAEIPMGGGSADGEKELWQLAQRTILEHGADAPIYAAARAGQLLRQGELEGTHTWCVVVRRASILLQRSTRTLN